jgi:hypothetical protein
MSYARFGWDGSDVYVFEHSGGFIQCCMCIFSEGDENWNTDLKTAREALAHLDAHVDAGHHVPARTFERMREEYKDCMDTPIEPYVTPPEVKERQRALMKELFGEQE